MEMTIEQQRALALANARLRAQTSNSNQAPVTVGSAGMEDAVKQELAGRNWADRQLIAAGTGLSNLIQGTKQIIPGMKADVGTIQANKVIRGENPVASFVGDAALASIPFGLAGNSVKAAGLIGGGYGALQPVDATNFSDIAKGKVASAAVSTLAGAGGQAAANRLLGGVTNKIAGIEQKVADKAAQVAASETASARSAAGNAAQNAYRQLEHLRELNASGVLSPQQKVLVAKLERELAEKAAEKLIPAVALKEQTALAYKDAMSTEAQRTAQYIADKLSGAEARQQFMARAKRYGPAVAGGLIGNMIFPGLGGSVGGAATGLVLRPALRSMVNFAGNPAVQHGVLSTVGNSGLLSGPVLPTATTLGATGLLGLMP